MSSHSPTIGNQFMQPRFTILILLIVNFGFPSVPQSSEFD